MNYIHLSSTPGLGVRDYQRVIDELGAEPIAGQVLHIVGESDGVLHIVDVWDSKAHADRFASERLFPAFDRAGLVPGPGHTEVALHGTVTVGSATEGARR